MRKYIVTAPPDRIEAMVAAGRLTRAEAEEMYENADSRVPTGQIPVAHLR